MKVESSNGSSKPPAENHQNGVKTNGTIKSLEDAIEKRERTVSLVIVYFTLFLQSLGLAIAMTGVWPFLIKVSSLVFSAT